MKKVKLTKVNMLIVALVVVAAAGLAGAGYLYAQNQQLKNNPQTAQDANKARVAELKAKVAKRIAVPKDETPVLATVSDKTKLKDQPFFKDAENGDAILIFPQAKKAIIYREKTDFIVNSGPIAITSDTAGTSSQSTTAGDSKTSTSTTTDKR
jgi:hypothetical protein